MHAAGQAGRHDPRLDRAYIKEARDTRSRAITFGMSRRTLSVDDLGQRSPQPTLADSLDHL
jgi:hypothetical protein